ISESRAAIQAVLSVLVRGGRGSPSANGMRYDRHGKSQDRDGDEGQPGRDDARDEIPPKAASHLIRTARTQQMLNGLAHRRVGRHPFRLRPLDAALAVLALDALAQPALTLPQLYDRLDIVSMRGIRPLPDAREPILGQARRAHKRRHPVLTNPDRP